MRYLIRVLMIVFVIGTFVAIDGGVVQPAYACSCMVPGPPQEALQQATAVFSGKVIAITTPQPEDVRVTFEVMRTWKGPNETPLVIATTGSSASCGFAFQPDTEYLVYATSFDERGLSVNLCSRTAALADAGEDINALGEGVQPQVIAPQADPVVPNTVLASPWLWAGVGGVAIVALGAAALVMRRRIAA